MSSFPCSTCKKECLAELLGTYTLVVLGPASVVIAPLIPDLGAGEVLAFIALTFGTVVGILILLLGKHSGAVFNPAITLGATLAKSLKSRYLFPYIFFQIMGGLLAGLTLRELFLSSNSSELGSTRLAQGITPFAGIALEAAGTFVLTASALIATKKIKQTLNQGMLVGATLFLLILIIGPITGAGFNPARSIGPSLASGYLQNLYVYIIGPILGGSLAGLVFRKSLRSRKDAKRTLNIVCMC